RLGGPHQGMASRGPRRLRLLQQRRDGLRAEERAPPPRTRFGLTVVYQTLSTFAAIWFDARRDESVRCITGGGLPNVEAHSRDRGGETRRAAGGGAHSGRHVAAGVADRPRGRTPELRAPGRRDRRRIRRAGSANRSASPR